MGLAIFRRDNRIIITAGSKTFEPLVEIDNPESAQHIPRLIQTLAAEIWPDFPDQFSPGKI
jgi:hypothetical protein